MARVERARLRTDEVGYDREPVRRKWSEAMSGGYLLDRDERAGICAGCWSPPDGNSEPVGKRASRRLSEYGEPLGCWHLGGTGPTKVHTGRSSLVPFEPADLGRRWRP
jgi:hypothetical protein